MLLPLVVLAVILAASVGLIAASNNPDNAHTLRLVAQAVTVLTVAVLAVPAFNDAGFAAVYLLGVPLVGAAVPSLTRIGWLWMAAGAGMVVWAITLALGIGLFLLPAGIVMIAAASAQQRSSTRLG